MSPLGSAARKPGNAWYTGPEANFPGMLQEEGPHLAASRAKLQPDSPFFIFSWLTLLPAISGKGKLACFTLLTREAGTARSPLGFSTGFRKPAPNPGEEKLSFSVLGPKLRKI